MVLPLSFPIRNNNNYNMSYANLSLKDTSTSANTAKIVLYLICNVLSISRFQHHHNGIFISLSSCLIDKQLLLNNLIRQLGFNFKQLHYYWGFMCVCIEYKYTGLQCHIILRNTSFHTWIYITIHGNLYDNVIGVFFFFFSILIFA